jgi:DNA-binding NtrC family response regulator
VARVGPSQASVLLLGESGTGKELVAQAVHDASPRAANPLVVVDCASLPETLFESELFGHERGAFTGANTSKPGLVEAASGGTLFLDEVGDIPLAMQVKLLRLLESGTYRRVGSTELRRTDVRVVSATHRNLKAMVADGRFREDLYYRLSTFPIALPALRERAEDIPLLAVALLDRVAPQRRLSLSVGTLDLLKRYPFPGNVRELRNVLERAALMADANSIDRVHMERALETAVAFPSVEGHSIMATVPSHQASPPGSSLRGVARAALQAELNAHSGSRAELARKLGISERSLYRKLREIGEDPDAA